jgi:hypothetical protein
VIDVSKVRIFMSWQQYVCVLINYNSNSIMETQLDQNATADKASNLNQKEIDIAVLQREKQKLEESEKKLFNKKTFIVTGIITAIIGGVIGYSSIDNYKSEFSVEFEVTDSLTANNIHKDELKNFILDTSKTYSRADSIHVLDSLKKVETKFRNIINDKNISEVNKSYWKWIPIGIVGGFLAGIIYM